MHDLFSLKKFCPPEPPICHAAHLSCLSARTFDFLLKQFGFVCLCLCAPYVCVGLCVCVFVCVVADTNQILNKRKLKAFAAAHMRQANSGCWLTETALTHTPRRLTHTHTFMYIYILLVLSDSWALLVL